MELARIRAALAEEARMGRPVPQYVLAGLADEAQAYQQLDAMNWIVARGWSVA